MMHGHWGYGYATGAWGFLVMALLMVIIIAGAIILAHYVWHGGDCDESDAALRLLRKRYARGEISRQEYEEKHRDLNR